MRNKTKEILDYLREEALREECLTNFHWNDTFLEFWERFFPEIKDVNKVKNRFTYYANKLVKEGFLLPAHRFGLGSGGCYDFGVRTQTIWGLKK